MNLNKSFFEQELADILNDDSSEFDVLVYLCKNKPL